MSFMLWREMVETFRKRPIPPTHRAVVFAISYFADEHGVAWPSLGTIRDVSGLSEKTIARVSGELIASNWLAIEKRRSTGQPERSLNVYRVLRTGRPIANRLVSRPQQGKAARDKRGRLRVVTVPDMGVTVTNATCHPEDGSGQGTDHVTDHQKRSEHQGPGPAKTDWRTPVVERPAGRRASGGSSGSCDTGIMPRTSTPAAYQLHRPRFDGNAALASTVQPRPLSVREVDQWAREVLRPATPSPIPAVRTNTRDPEDPPEPSHRPTPRQQLASGWKGNVYDIAQARPPSPASSDSPVDLDHDRPCRHAAFPDPSVGRGQLDACSVPYRDRESVADAVSGPAAELARDVSEVVRAAEQACAASVGYDPGAPLAGPLRGGSTDLAVARAEPGDVRSRGPAVHDTVRLRDLSGLLGDSLERSRASVSSAPGDPDAPPSPTRHRGQSRAGDIPDGPEARSRRETPVPRAARGAATGPGTPTPSAPDAAARGTSHDLGVNHGGDAAGSDGHMPAQGGPGASPKRHKRSAAEIASAKAEKDRKRAARAALREQHTAAHVRVTYAYCEGYRERRGIKPVFTGQEGQAVWRLLAKLDYDADRAVKLIEDVLEHRFWGDRISILMLAADPGRYECCNESRPPAHFQPALNRPTRSVRLEDI